MVKVNTKREREKRIDGKETGSEKKRDRDKERRRKRQTERRPKDRVVQRPCLEA